jgi:RecJ-like exonuclease
MPDKQQTEIPAALQNPGDEAPPGTAGTGEDVCPKCHGSGKISGSDCENCGGTGRVIRAIGGA